MKQREKDEATIPGYTKPNDAIEWIWDLVPNEDKKNYGYQGIAQLAIAAVSVRTTSKLLTNIVLNLIAYPEYVPILKEEIENVLASCDGQWTLDSMSKLEKLDSFMKESLRFDTPLTGHPPSFLQDLYRESPRTQWLTLTQLRFNARPCSASPSAMAQFCNPGL